MKKILSGLVIALCLALVYGCDNNADPFAKIAAPITQAQVDAYVKAIPQLVDNQGNNNRLQKIYTEIGGTDIKGAYVVAKISAAYAIVEMPAQKDSILSQFPESVWPSDAEIDLVTKNKDKIFQAMMKHFDQ